MQVQFTIILGKRLFLKANESEINDKGQSEEARPPSTPAGAALVGRGEVNRDMVKQHEHIERHTILEEC